LDTMTLKGSRKNKFTFLMDKLSSFNLGVKHIASTLFEVLSGKPKLDKNNLYRFP